MPRMDNPNIKLKPIHSFKRKNLRPWDDPHNFIPNKILENLDSNPIGGFKFSSNNHAPTIETNSKQKLINQETFAKQTANEKVNDNETKGKQIFSKKETIEEHIVNILENDNETNDKRIREQLVAPKEYNLHKEEISYEEIFKNTKLLVGLQRKALFYIVENCKIGGVLYTSPLTNEFLKQLLKTDTDSVKTTIQRLINKGLLKRKEGKKGNGGYTVFSITETVRNAVAEINRQMYIYNQWETNGRQCINELGNKKETNNGTNASVVSSSFINITTTTLPEDFKKIDYSSLTEIGFDESHIIQIHREYIQKPEITLSAQIIQNSINALAFDLKYNNIASDLKRPAAVFLTSLLKKGQPYSSKTPEKVLSPQEEAMREYVLAEEKKQNYITDIENKMKDLTLQKWLSSLTEEELLNFNQDSSVRPQGMPEKIHQISRRKKAIELAKEYFGSVLWYSKRSEILTKSNAEERENN